MTAYLYQEKHSSILISYVNYKILINRIRRVIDSGVTALLKINFDF